MPTHLRPSLASSARTSPAPQPTSSTESPRRVRGKTIPAPNCPRRRRFAGSVSKAPCSGKRWKSSAYAAAVTLRRSSLRLSRIRFLRCRSSLNWALSEASPRGGISTTPLPWPCDRASTAGWLGGRSQAALANANASSGLRRHYAPSKRPTGIGSWHSCGMARVWPKTCWRFSNAWRHR